MFLKKVIGPVNHRSALGRRTHAVTMAGALALGLVACGGSDSSEPAADADESAAPTSASPTAPAEPILLPTGLSPKGTTGEGLMMFTVPEVAAEEISFTFSGQDSDDGYVIIDETGTPVEWSEAPQVEAATSVLTELGLLVTGTETGGDALGSGEQVVALLDPADGEVMWSQPFGDETLPEDCTARDARGELVLVTCPETAVFLDAETGEKRFETPMSQFEGPAELNTRIVSINPPIVDHFTNRDDAESMAAQHVDVLDPASGEVVSSVEGTDWPTTSWSGIPNDAYPLDGASYVHSGENFIVPGREDLATEAESMVSAIDTQGQSVWSVESDGNILGANSDHVLIKVESTDSLVVLDAATGEITETIEAPADSPLAEASVASFVSPDVVAVSTSSDYVYIAGIDQLGDLTAASSAY